MIDEWADRPGRVVRIHGCCWCRKLGDMTNVKRRRYGEDRRHGMKADGDKTAEWANQFRVSFIVGQQAFEELVVTAEVSTWHGT